MKIPLIKLYITDEVKAEVLKVLDSGYLTEGPVTHEFEDVFKRYIGCRHAIAVTSCTTGLEMALRAVGIGPGDEVIVPDYTYPATAAVVNIVGATAILVDVDSGTMLIDCDTLEEAITERTRAVIPVSIFGNPLEYDRLNPIRKNHGIFIIEDAACSVGASYKGKRVGTFADISVFSFHPRKFITTGEGGIVTTDNTVYADWMETYKHFGMRAAAISPACTEQSIGSGRGGAGVMGIESISFEMIGTNYKLSNIQAAVGLAQMRHVNELLEKRMALARNYTHLLRDCPVAKIPVTTLGGEHSYQSFCVFVEKRDEVMRSMREQGIEVQIGTYALHMHKAFNDNPKCRIAGDMKGSTYAYEHCLVLPMHHEMTESDQQYVVETLINTMNKL